MERPNICGTSEASNATRPRAIATPSGPTSSTVSPEINSPSTAVTPAGSSETPRSLIAVTAPASRINFPCGVAACASQSNREDFLLVDEWKNVPNTSPDNAAPTSASDASSVGIPAPVAIRAASTLVTIPPLPTPADPMPPITASEISSITWTSEIFFAFAEDGGAS